MSEEKSQLLKGIAALEAQRTLLGDAVIDVALAALRDKLTAFEEQGNTDPPATGAHTVDGAPVPSAAAGQAQVLKQVTILFLDVVGSTSLSAGLDPEEIHALMDGALARATEIVSSYGGRVLSYAGDNLLAVWGAEEARETDPERAVHCGLALVQEGRILRQEVYERHGWSGFDVRVGIHTGDALLGGGLGADMTIRGQAVNIAARMEQAAPAGALRISRDTYQHVRGVFDVDAQPPLEVKGVERPLLTYLVRAAKSRAFRTAARGIEGIETPLVGRETEFAQLAADFRETVEDRRLRATTIFASAGLGKSRLMHDLQQWFDTQSQDSWLLLGRSQPTSSLQPYGLMREVLAWRLQIADSASAEEARRDLVEGLAPYFDENAIEIRVLGQLIGMDFSADPEMLHFLRDPRLLRSRGFAAFSDFLRRLVPHEGSLAVMLLDDLQWSDDASLDWLQYLLNADDLPLVLVMGARPELLERFPKWCAGLRSHREMHLKPLDAEQQALLVRSLLLAVADLPLALTELIESRAEGNPYYAEELVKMLIDDEVIIVEGPVWRVQSERLQRAHIPGTLTGVLQARLDALNGRERRALQQASVIGSNFWDAALAAIDPDSVLVLEDLRRRNLVFLRPESTFEDTQEESFQHHLLHQVTYNTVLKAERRHAHSRAAKWLAERVSHRRAEYLGVTAEHYERSGETAAAIEWYKRATEEALARFANGAALSYLKRLLDMPAFDNPNQRFEIYGKQQALADLIGDRALQQAAIDAAEALIERCDDRLTKRSWVLITRALFNDRIGEIAKAEQFASAAAKCSEACGEASNAALAYGELAWLAMARAAYSDTEKFLELGLKWAKQAALEMKHPLGDMYEIQLLNLAGQYQLARMDFEPAAKTIAASQHLAKERHYRRSEALGHDSLSSAMLELGDLDAAEASALAAGKIARDTGFGSMIASEGQLLGRIAFERGDYPGARRLLNQAAIGYMQIGSAASAASCQLLEVLAGMAVGAWAECRELLERIEPFFSSHEMPAEVHVCRIFRAQCSLHLDLAGEALQSLEQEPGALQTPEALHHTNLELDARLAVWRILTALDDERARPALDEAMTSVRRRIAKISDASVRSRILRTRPAHRAIIAAWRAAGGVV